MKKSKLVLIMVFMLVVGIGIGAGAATLFASDQVLYKDSTTVKTALDDLYSKANYGNATAAQILSGKTALVGGSKITGSMANLSSSTPYQHTSSNTTKSILGDAAYVTDLYNTSTSSSPGKYVEIRYNSTAGYITGNTLFAVPQATMASAIGLTADKLVSGNTILGVAGSIPSRASSGNVKGDKAWAYENKMYFGVDYGYYPKANFGGLTDVSERYITYSSLARDIGLTAAKIAKGNTILGIAGTYTGGNAKSGSLSTAAGGTYTISTGLSSISNFTIYLKDTVCGVGINMAVYSPSVLGSGYYYPSMNTSGCGGGSPGRMSVGTGDTSLYFKINSVSGGNVSITVPTSSGHYGTPSYWLAS